MIASSRKLDHSAARVASLPFFLDRNTEKLFHPLITRTVFIFVAFTLADRASLGVANVACGHIVLNALRRNECQAS